MHAPALRPFFSGARYLVPRRVCTARRAAVLFGGVLALLSVTFAIASPGGEAELMTVTVQSSQPKGAGLGLSVGLAIGGDGSTCGTEPSVAVLAGTLIDFCYTVTNNSITDLAYSTLDDSVDGNLFRYSAISIPAGGSYVWHRQIRAAASNTYEATWAAQDVAPNYIPDDTVPSAFVDISATGTALPVSFNGGGASVAMPFRFPFYGDVANQLCISNDGVIVFDLSGTNCGTWNFVLPKEFCSPPDIVNVCQDGSLGALIAPFYDDLYDASGGVYFEARGSSPNREFIVEWDRAHWLTDGSCDCDYETPLRAHVEVILGEDGSISFQYETTDFGYTDPFSGFVYNHGNTASIGLRNGQHYRGPINPMDGLFSNQYSYPNGDYPRTQLPFADPMSIVWTPAQGIVYSASAGVSVDVGEPVIDVAPVGLSATAPSGGSTPVTTSISIANTGTYALNWSVAAASAASPIRPAEVGARPAERAAVATSRGRAEFAAGSAPASAERSPIRRSAVVQQAASRGPAIIAASSTSKALTTSTECADDVPKVIIHDDGLAEDAFAGGPVGVDSIAVERFTPLSYPATFISACVAFTVREYPTSPAQGPVAYEVVVYDDTGPQGGPGNELGAISANTIGTGADSLGVPGIAIFNDRVDISSLNLNIASGSVYIGVRWNPDQASGYTIYLDADEDGTDGVPPLNTPEGGYFYDSFNDVFVPTGNLFSDESYVAMMIRAVEGAPGCANLEDVPWLSVSPLSGTVAVGSPALSLIVTLNPAGLADGTYSATICIDSNYGAGTAVPVAFTVGGVDDAIFANGFEVP